MAGVGNSNFTGGRHGGGMHGRGRSGRMHRGMSGENNNFPIQGSAIENLPMIHDHSQNPIELK